MTDAAPPQIQELLDNFRQALAQVEGFPVDPVTASWTDVEKGVIKLLGGAYDARRPQHGAIAMMVGAALAARLQQAHGAFWFPSREAPGGAALGFPDAIVTVAPLAAAAEALSQSRLPMLDEVVRDIGQAVGRARFGINGNAAGSKPGPAEYQAMFDPGFTQMLALDLKKADKIWSSTPDVVARDIEDALARAPKSLPEEAREGMRQQLAGGLRRLDASKTVGDQIPVAPRLAEVSVLLNAQGPATGFVPEELWRDLLLPLLHAGAPDVLPPVGDDEIAVMKQDADPLMIYVDVVPYATPVADEDGLLGVFHRESIGLLHDNFTRAEASRLFRVDAEALRVPLSRFDAARVRAAVTEFSAQLVEKSGMAVPSDEVSQVLDVALHFIADLQQTVDACSADTALFVRYATQMEAAASSAVQVLREAMSAPRIVLV